MSIRFGATVLITAKYEAMTSFYRDVLEQEIQVDFGGCMVYKCGLSVWELKEEYPIAKKLGHLYDPAGNRNMEVSFESDEFEKVLEKLDLHDLEYLHRIEEEAWGQRTVRFFDPDRNLVEVGESIPCFVSRFYDSGMSLEQVAERTSVPLEFVRQICSPG